ncbi:MAG: DNA translocase FtsK 4TM domain-containing protein, partial [Nonlabens sp.]
MARKKTSSKKTTAKTSKPFQLPNLKLNRLQEVIVGSALIVVGLLLLFSFISYLFTGAQDQSVLVELGSRTTETKNWISQLGAWLGHTFVYKGFGIPAFSIAILTIISGIFLFATGDKVFSL